MLNLVKKVYEKNFQCWKYQRKNNLEGCLKQQFHRTYTKTKHLFRNIVFIYSMKSLNPSIYFYFER